MKDTILVARKVSKGQSPLRSGKYLTLLGYLYFNYDMKTWTNFVRHEKDNQKEIQVEDWFEVMTNELVSLAYLEELGGGELPTDGEIDEKYSAKANHHRNPVKDMKQLALTALAKKDMEIAHWKERWKKSEERCDISDMNVTNLFFKNKTLKEQAEKASSLIEHHLTYCKTQGYAFTENTLQQIKEQLKPE